MSRSCTFCRRPLEPRGSSGARALTWDHYPVPLARGGHETVPACWCCNNLKGDMTAEKWHAFMAANPYWWQTHGPRPGAPGIPAGNKAKGRTAAEVIEYLDGCSALTQIDWPWLRELTGSRVRQVGWGQIKPLSETGRLEAGYRAALYRIGQAATPTSGSSALAKAQPECDAHPAQTGPASW